MEIIFKPFESQARARISQLINKSNQYNLTTRRYSEADVAAAEADAQAFTLQVRLKDRFADNGMISVVICRRQDRDWVVDTWLMSCRVLGRGVEAEVLGSIGRHARAAGIVRLVGVYKPTERNGMVAGHYAKLGFAPVGQDEDGTTRWALELDRLPDRDTMMRVVDFGEAHAQAEPAPLSPLP